MKFREEGELFGAQVEKQHHLHQTPLKITTFSLLLHQTESNIVFFYWYTFPTRHLPRMCAKQTPNTKQIKVNVHILKGTLVCRIQILINLYK